jgi:solute carrier family 25 (mitochondrial aspartate/glutamate transporter), member 12/13
MEMLKIRLQVEAALPRAQQRPTMSIVREVLGGGPAAVYRGAAATLLRDVPFSLLYFPTFSNLKAAIARQDSHGMFSVLLREGTTPDETNINRRVNGKGTFVAGTAAGMLAGWAATPADVIKTRLQSQGGTERWVNIRTCAQRTWQQEGPRAFFKGAQARMFLIGALFGVVVLTYETLPNFIPM